MGSFVSSPRAHTAARAPNPEQQISENDVTTGMFGKATKRNDLFRCLPRVTNCWSGEVPRLTKSLVSMPLIARKE
jgi:hypothetical protein